jgi:hypothetical protein
MLLASTKRTSKSETVRFRIWAPYSVPRLIPCVGSERRVITAPPLSELYATSRTIWGRTITLGFRNDLAMFSKLIPQMIQGSTQHGWALKTSFAVLTGVEPGSCKKFSSLVLQCFCVATSTYTGVKFYASSTGSISYT